MMAQRGFILLPVTLLLALVATVAFIGNRETALASGIASATDNHDKARFAAEAGLQRVTAVMHTKGCGGTYPWLLSPSKDTAFDGASYSASAGLKTSGTPVTIYSTGTYGDASVSLTRTVPMHLSTPVTITLQPDVAGLDTYLSSSSSSPNGSAGTMLANPGVAYPTLKFDLPAAWVPPGSHITSATLSTYANSGNGSAQVALHRVTRDWTEAGATWASADGTTAWSTPGGDVHATAVASTAFNGSGGVWLNWDITALADRWSKGSLPNQGVQIRAGAGISGLTLASSDSGAAAQRPKLALTFLPPCDYVPPILTLTLNPTGDVDIDGNILVQLSNFGADPTLYLSKGNEARPMLKFDVSAIPAGKVVQSATLRLYFESLFSGTKLSKNLVTNVYTATKPWNEMEANWLYRILGSLWALGGGEYNSTAIATQTLAQNMTPGQWIEFPITAQVQSWIDGVTVNNGLLMRITTNSTEELIFSSREAATNRPELVIVYQP